MLNHLYSSAAKSSETDVYESTSLNFCRLCQPLHLSIHARVLPHSKTTPPRVTALTPPAAGARAASNQLDVAAAVDRRDRRTDGRTADRFIDAHGQRQCTDRETLQKRKFLYSAKHRITLWNVVLLRYYRYDTTRDAILTCARKPTRVSLIYCTEPTTKKCKKTDKKLKSKKRICSEVTVNSPENPCSQSWRRNEGYGGKDLQKKSFEYNHCSSI